MFFVGNEFDKDNGGYKTIAQAKKQAEKKKMKVFDENGVQVYPEEGETNAQEPQEATETSKAGENTPEEENATETARSEPDGAEKEPEESKAEEMTEEMPEEKQQEAKKTASAAKIAKLRQQTGATFDASAVGTIKVVRAGMIAIRNAPKKDTGHKCGIAKTGYTARTVGRFDTPDGAFYELENGRYISADKEDTEFTPD